MLVLSRKPQESICQGDHIRITILATKGRSVRVGVEAPQDINILRGELWNVRHEFAGAASELEQPTESPFFEC